jgi:hypothetical protein
VTDFIKVSVLFLNRSVLIDEVEDCIRNSFALNDKNVKSYLALICKAFKTVHIYIVNNIFIIMICFIIYDNLNR